MFNFSNVCSGMKVFVKQLLRDKFVKLDLYYSDRIENVKEILYEIEGNLYVFYQSCYLNQSLYLKQSLFINCTLLIAIKHENKIFKIKKVSLIKYAY